MENSWKNKFFGGCIATLHGALQIAKNSNNHGYFVFYTVEGKTYLFKRASDIELVPRADDLESKV